jgi:polyisoprenoid-binding protein YceI
MTNARFKILLTSAVVFVFALLLVTPLTPFAQTTDLKPNIASAPSGLYQLDANHASVTFKILHMGFSRYTGRFDKMEATLNFDNGTPEKSELNVTIYPNSVDTNNAKLEEELREDKWFNVIKFPRATFRSTSIERTGPTTGKITGDFTLLGITHKLTLDTTLIGVGQNLFTKKPVVGFSATGILHRSDYGLSNLIPMVSNDVTLEIEAEFDKAD